MAVTLCGFQTYLPLIDRRRIIAGIRSTITVPRFGIYFFANFDQREPGWEQIVHGDCKRRGVVDVLRNCDKPSPVPDEAIDAIKSYQPPIPDEIAEPYRYNPGEYCKVMIAGSSKPAVFVGYQGNRMFVRTWIFGAERVSEVTYAELEPLLIDNPVDTDTKATV